MAGAVHPVALAHRAARELFLARQPQGESLKVVCSREQPPLAEPVRLRAARQERQDELVSGQEAQPASGQLEFLQVPALAAWEQFSVPQAQRPQALLRELL